MDAENLVVDDSSYWETVEALNKLLPQLQTIPFIKVSEKNNTSRDLFCFVYYVCISFRLSLPSFASWLLSHGIKNAINLDGGGSASFVVNGTIINNPSDHW